MLDEENDKRIKEAAEHYHPAYDETAWEKMEQLLDVHLPQEKRRKRIFFLLPLLLMVGGLAFFIVLDHGNKSEVSDNMVSKNKKEATLPAKPGINKKEATLSAKPGINATEHITTQSSSPGHKKILMTGKENSGKQMVNSASEGKKSNGNRFSSSITENEKEPAGLLPGNNNDDLTGKISYAGNENPVAENPLSREPDSLNQHDLLLRHGQEHKDADTVTDKNLLNGPQKAFNKKETRSAHNGFANDFGISLSAGPDISAVHVNNAGKITLSYGAGLNYAISKKLTVRTGFYIFQKIYSVSPEDYSMPAGNTGNYDHLENVDANCKVYVIPLTADYHFKRDKNHNWFVSAGLLSYLMKRENYDYYYKTAAGEAYYKDWTISNKNRHYLSVLSLSGGYQYFFNRQFSLIAEPYINVPLKGIGAGKVKLNSGGILFTLGIKPFLKKNK